MTTRRKPSELEHSWPAIVFAAAIVFAFVFALGYEWARTVALVLLVAAFVPCCLIRDWWIRHHYEEDHGSH